MAKVIIIMTSLSSVKYSWMLMLSTTLLMRELVYKRLVWSRRGLPEFGRKTFYGSAPFSMLVGCMKRKHEKLDAIRETLTTFGFALCLPLFVVIMLFAVPDEEMNRQKLTVVVPVSKDVSEAMLPLFLSQSEVELLKRLRQVSKISRKKDRMILKYSGERIYYPNAKVFVVNGKTYSVKNVVVQRASTFARD